MRMSYMAEFGERKERRRETLLEAGERPLARVAREAWSDEDSFDVDIVVRWGLDGDEERVVALLELNGMPRWAAFEERFIVAERDGEILAAVRYRSEKERLALGLLVADPWAGERALALALYAGAGELAREMGVGEVVVPAGAWGCPGEAGYRRWGRGWRLDAARVVEGREEFPVRGWRRVVEMVRAVFAPFFRAFGR